MRTLVLYELYDPGEKREDGTKSGKRRNDKREKRLNSYI
jgi:hypothetical protein